VAIAFRLLFGSANKGQSGIEIARYFLNLHTRNKNGWLYREEWPTPGRANPMIVGLFAMTQTLPSDGDQTSWCAAFVNFCLNVSGFHGTDSALSGSFRRLIDQPASSTAKPKTGDLVVFRDVGSSGDDANGHGHVGFFVRPENVTTNPNSTQRGQFYVNAQEERRFKSGMLHVLGGNQRGSDTGSTGGVKVAVFPMESAALRCLGFVSATSLTRIEVA
jgi:hypothetical protein